MLLGNWNDIDINVKVQSVASDDNKVCVIWKEV